MTVDLDLLTRQVLGHVLDPVNQDEELLALIAIARACIDAGPWPRRVSGYCIDCARHQAAPHRDDCFGVKMRAVLAAVESGAGG